ncbi:hydroxyethylthiazole kinase [Rhodophyticola sp. CCM32]|uniref:hydroxyethylthiazole kinase n=1 Tax=Rhodophyticola sp. CCM32 TaxID=2916397 RepID=UPI00107EEB47|nr:hydroxyethylthiazole kinase [Rhodophyticola sp. CCM32]QBY00623.1 hydroxyethylthiazole kinase [Rhodophyticola sp. CCM32]
MEAIVKISPAQALAEMRATIPLVQCITNYVAMNVAANTLLAIGASPAMVHTADEAEEFAVVADALTINIGTLSPTWVAGMTAAITGARQAGRPWIFDPVALHATAYRRDVAARLMDFSPTIVRGNASEILALSGGGGAGRGADATDPVAAAEAGARKLAAGRGCVVAVTGAVDFVTDGRRAAKISGGSELMPQVTALGCSLTCLVGAFAAAVTDPFDATVGALATFAAAGEAAAQKAVGPGSFGWRFLDALAALDGAALESTARVTLT